jgi:hypothetical protein
MGRHRPQTEYPKGGMLIPKIDMAKVGFKGSLFHNRPKNPCFWELKAVALILQ